MLASPTPTKHGSGPRRGGRRGAGGQDERGALVWRNESPLSPGDMSEHLAGESGRQRVTMRSARRQWKSAIRWA